MEIKNEQSMEQAILETAEQLFLEKGFKLTSTTQIAKEVGCNQALVHYYFRTKHNLFNTIFENKFKLFFQRLFDTTQIETMNFTEKITYIIETHFDILAENPKLPMLIMNELSQQPDQIKILREKLQALPQQLFTLMNRELEQEIAAGRTRNIGFLDIMITIVSLNVAIFAMLPVAANIIELSEKQQKMLLIHRRSENVNVVLNYLKP